MSKTPRTDEREFAAIDLKPSARVVYASFARQLETELADKEKQLAEARAEIEKATATEAERWAERLNWLHTKYGADCSGTDSADLLDCVEDEIKQVINSQSELIEQMREALKIVKAHMHKTGDFYAIDDVNAALSAAERDEL